MWHGVYLLSFSIQNQMLKYTFLVEPDVLAWGALDWTAGQHHHQPHPHLPQADPRQPRPHGVHDCAHEWGF